MKILRYLWCALATVALATSCTSPKSSLTYFEDIPQTGTGEIPTTGYGVKIQPDDELFITVTSIQPTATTPYNLPMTNFGSNDKLKEPAAQPLQQTYVVNSTGDIVFPVLGKIHVAGLTTEELTALLTEKISADVVDPVVLVRLANFSVQVMGEVLTPGTIPVTRERFSLLDALAAAGDLTPYGERSNVLLIRDTDGKRQYHRFNLNESEVLSSPYFYLQPNDVIMVQPNSIRQDNAKYNQNNAYKLTVISTIVSAASVVASLVIALTIN